jgi:beta-lactamase regulating signal transducer with metallopeptidase domain
MLLALIEGLVVEYIANCIWQIPLLAFGAWLLIRIVRPALRAQHWLWLSSLAMALVLPACGIYAHQPQHTETYPTISPLIMDRALALAEPTPAIVASKAPQPESRTWKTPFRSAEFRLSPTATHWLAGIYCATILAGFLRFLWACRAARRLVRNSCEASLPQPLFTALEAYSCKLQVALPQVRESNRVAGPAIVGAIEPVMLLPERFAEHTGREIEAALFHELAHVQRRDYLVNLVCHVAALPIVWHPATAFIEQRIRRTREMLCDEMAAEQMHSSTDYARCLVALAQGIVRANNTGHAVGLFDNNTMEERVMRLTEAKPVRSVREKLLRGAVGASTMLVVLTTAAIFHLTPTRAAIKEAELSAELAAMHEATQAPIPAAATSEASSSNGTSTSTASGSSNSKDSAEKYAIIVATTDDEKRPTAIAGKGATIHRWKSADGKPMVWVNHDKQEPTAEEKLRIEQQLKDSQKNLDDANDLFNVPPMQFKLDKLHTNLGDIDTSKLDQQLKVLDSPSFLMQMPRLENNPPFIVMNKLDGPGEPIVLQFNKHQMDALKLQIEAAKKQLADSTKVFDTPEWKAQMAAAQKQLTSTQVQQEIEEAKRLIQDAERHMQEMKKQ